MVDTRDPLYRQPSGSVVAVSRERRGGTKTKFLQTSRALALPQATGRRWESDVYKSDVLAAEVRALQNHPSRHAHVHNSTADTT